MRIVRLSIIACAAALCLAPSADGYAIRGAGYGHGVGMSQYGAYGFALNGRSFRLAARLAPLNDVCDTDGSSSTRTTLPVERPSSVPE